MKEDVALFQPLIATVINLRQKLVDGAKVSIPLRGLGVFNRFRLAREHEVEQGRSGGRRVWP
jgi:hypothetical protein